MFRSRRKKDKERSKESENADSASETAGPLSETGESIFSTSRIGRETPVHFSGVQVQEIMATSPQLDQHTAQPPQESQKRSPRSRATAPGAAGRNGSRARHGGILSTTMSNISVPQVPRCSASREHASVRPRTEARLDIASSDLHGLLYCGQKNTLLCPGLSCNHLTRESWGMTV